MNRRGFLLGILAAPVLVRASSLDYVPRGVVLHKPGWRLYEIPDPHVDSIQYWRLAGDSVSGGWRITSPLSIPPR